MQVAPDQGRVLKQAADAAMETDDPRAVELDQTLADLIEREEALTHDHYVEGIMSADAYRVTMTAIKRKRESVERERVRLNVDSTHFKLTQAQLHGIWGPPVSLAEVECPAVEYRGVTNTVYAPAPLTSLEHGAEVDEEHHLQRPVAAPGF